LDRGLSEDFQQLIEKGFQHPRSNLGVMSSSSDVSAISTTFTPPATCTQGHLTLMEYYQYQIWLNYPVPVPGTTSTACYPSQFISSYFSAQDITTPLPAPTPLVCPVGYGTILSTTVSSSDYIACCPS
jgi:hypothetical protein